MRAAAGFFVILLIKLICLMQNASANEVLGCGGFIKSHADIDFSKVEIKLLTKQGSLKDKTDCSPSNGYYFLPIYDKGEYLLRISPPPGWSFAPEQVELNFDGKTDICSQGKDVNFAFKGFGITGKVALAGHGASGARGVDVELIASDANAQEDGAADVRRTTTTDLNGIFSFTPIIPGKYVVRASHSKWHFSRSEHVVVVVSGNTELPENSLIVSGFDVAGRFDTNGQLTSGIGVAIFREKGQTLPLKCNQGASPIALIVKNANYESNAACYAQVDKSGDYLLKGVAPGKYLMQPVIENTNLKVHISPDHQQFEVTKDTLELKNDFKITGFSVSGKVLSSTTDSGLPIAAAIVKLNGQKVAETNAKGGYTLDNVKSGTYTLQVEAPQLQFNEQQVKLHLATPTLPDAVASAYQVCGKVISTKSYVVGITKHASTFHTTVSSKAESGGEWCAYLPSGKFSVEVLTTDADKASGVQFFPVQQNVEVQSQPMSGITFSQLRAVLSGELKCLPDAPKTCTAAEVTLHSLDAAGQPSGQKQSVSAQNGKYAFKDILPGPYEITIPQSSLCFDSTRTLINVATATETASPLVQRGYEVSIISSHRAIMKYTFTSAAQGTTASAIDTLKLLAGVNTFCVPRFGSYNIKLEGCHAYDDTLPKTFTTAETNPIMINAVAHKVGVRVLSSEPNADSLQLVVESLSQGDKQLVTPVAEAHKIDGKFAYRYDTHLKPEETLRITPKSDILLFAPQTRDIVGTNDCVDIAFNFVATRGLILRAKVVPAIKDAKITLTFPQKPELAAQTAFTSVTGEFKFGPIDESLEFALTAEKESYVFSEYNRASASFSAHKLCEIVVKVKDEAGKGLAGVLLSLSGGESYRKNLITGDNGAINFHSLSPSQYFLRPMMKEYKFEPNSKMIEIKDGETVEVELVGKRVAYSVFGVITSLNGEPFGQVNIEATADEACQHHQEEATSETNGQYRLRGLQPDCTYTIRPKDVGTSPTTNVERSIPESRRVRLQQADVRGINLIAISPLNFVDVTARVTASLNEHYKTLRILMYRKGATDSPIYSQRVETPLQPKARYNPGIMVFLPRIPLDGRTYVVELKSTLSDKTYTYALPVEQFVASGSSSVYLELDFKPEVRAAEADLNQNSISALVLVALVAIAFFKQDIAMDFLNFVWSRVNGLAQDLAQKQKNNSKKDVRRVAEPINQREIEQMAEQINAIKKKKTKKI